MARAQGFPAGLLQWCQGSSIYVKDAARTMNESLDSNANDYYKPSSCVDLCALERVRQIANCWAVEKRAACSPGRRKSATSSTVFFISLSYWLSCAQFLDFLSRRALHSVFLRTIRTAPSRSSELALKLLACTRPPPAPVQPEVRLDACGKAATLHLRETHELLGRSKVMFCRTSTVATSGSEPKPEMEGLFFGAAVTPERLAFSPVSCSLFHLSRMGRPAGCRPSRLLHLGSFSAAIVYNSEECTAF